MKIHVSEYRTTNNRVNDLKIGIDVPFIFKKPKIIPTFVNFETMTYFVTSQVSKFMKNREKINENSHITRINREIFLKFCLGIHFMAIKLKITAKFEIHQVVSSFVTSQIQKIINRSRKITKIGI